jgi:hypothetical protein
MSNVILFLPNMVTEKMGKLLIEDIVAIGPTDDKPPYIFLVDKEENVFLYKGSVMELTKMINSIQEVDNERDGNTESPSPGPEGPKAA